MLAGGPWQEDLPYYNSSFIERSVTLARENLESMTGVYLFLPLSVQVSRDASEAVVVSDDVTMSAVIPPFLQLGLTVSGSIWIDPAVIRSGSALAAVPNLTSAAIRHNLSALGAVRDSLLKKGIEALGEDRVRGRNIDELVGLIWMSPLHRDLVLNPVADAMGIAVRQDSEGFFAVILVGKKLAGPVAKNSRDK